MDSQQLERWLETKAGQEVYTPGLERVTKCLNLLDLIPSSKVITIGGTNGKGSVSRALYHSLQQKYSVALFTSPHLYCLTERFKNSYGKISIEDLEKLFKQVDLKLSAQQISLTYYEFLFISFMYWLKQNWPDFIILEVGLGGRLDATNSLDADLTVITSIGRDHQEYLGSTYRSILKEKLGITRAGKPLITAFKLKYLRQLTESYCREKGVFWQNIDDDNDFYQTNMKLVNAIIKKLNLDLEIIMPPPMQRLEINSVKIDFFGSHNPDAARKLVQFIQQGDYNNKHQVYDYILLSFSQRSQEDILVMLSLFKSLVPHWAKNIIVTSFEHNKAMNELGLKTICKQNGIEFVKDYKEKLNQASSLLCSGSNYFYRSFVNKFRSNQ